MRDDDEHTGGAGHVPDAAHGPQPRPSLNDGQRRTLKLQIAVSAAVMLACVLGFVWVVTTRELSFAGSFGLLGGHWAFALIMPGLLLSLVGILTAWTRLRYDGRVLPPEDEEAEP